MKKGGITLILCSLLLLSCNKKHAVKHSFCFWKTNLILDKEDDSLIRKMNVKHMYVRFFDVDWNPHKNESFPIANIKNLNFNNSNIEVTPSVFITNEVFLNTNKKQLDTLALLIINRINEIAKEYSRNKLEKKNFPIDFKEVLIDCDWSPKSKDSYFYLLSQIKKNLPDIQLVATIRLWQYKYATKAGTPPVDRGLLMCYNITKPNDINTENSIGTSKELSQYITHNKYKLKLDLALPIYSWVVLFRGNQYKGLISDYEKLLNDTVKLKEVLPNKYILKQDIMIGNTYLRNGDVIRIEKISNDELEKMISIVKNKIAIDNSTKVTFFSFDKKYINDYGAENISEYYARF